jgi:hypothetical protein
MPVNNSKVLPSRPVCFKNKVVVVDGIVGGGKGLMSALVGALPKVEMWVHRPKIEQICAMHHLGHLSLEGAVSLLKMWIDEEAYNLSMVREINCRPSDMSSIFKDARPLRYIKRLFLNDGADAIKRVIDDSMIVNIMTHSNAGFSLPLFNALGDRLVYVRLTRCPMNEYMLNHLSRWSKRWGSDVRTGMLLHKNIINEHNTETPFFMLNNEEEYHQSTPLEKAVLMLKQWQRGGNNFIDDLKNTSYAKVIEIPFEKFVFEPTPFLNDIADALGTNIDSVTLKMMKKQGVPRKSLTDAPFNKTYAKLGWSTSEKHMTFMEDFNATKAIYENKLSAHSMNLLEDISNEYIQRHKLL